VLLGTVTHHFDPRGGGNFDAIPFDAQINAPAIDWVDGAGDQLVFRYSGNNSVSTMAYIPNGDGPELNGRFPTITLPLTEW
jgi:hypothetical protein